MSTDALPPLLKEFGPTRIRATPITEAALTGMGIGAAGSGFRPIVDWRQVTFSFVAMDQIVNQAAKIHYMEERGRPTAIDVVVTRDPAQMLPAVDNRTVEIKKGDRVA